MEIDNQSRLIATPAVTNHMLSLKAGALQRQPWQLPLDTAPAEGTHVNE